MRWLMGVLFLYSIWLAAVTIGAETLLRAGPEQSPEQMIVLSTIDGRHPGVLDWLSRFSDSREGRLDSARAYTKAEPYIGSSWACLFERKLESRQLDGELVDALSQAVRYSPYDPVNQERLIRVSLQSWLVLTPKLKRSIVELAADSLEGKATHRLYERRTLVRESGLLPLVCQISTDSICDKGLEG